MKMVENKRFVITLLFLIGFGLLLPVAIYAGDDTLAPVTFYEFTETSGGNGWYTSVEVTLSPYDFDQDTSTPASGVYCTYYKVGGQWYTHYGEYDFSFYLPEGKGQEVEFYSVDNAGNEESHRFTDKRNVDWTEPESMGENFGFVKIPRCFEFSTARDKMRHIKLA